MSAHHCRIVPALIVLAGFAADAASAGEFSICAERNQATSEMVLTMANGCVSSSLGYLGHDLRAEIDENRAWIRISGNFNYEPARGNNATADCMNAKQLTIQVPDTEARRYVVSHDGEFAGIIDLTAETGRVCAIPVSTGISSLQYHDWKSVDVADWTPRSATSLMDLIAPLTSGHPESSEGRPTLKIELAPLADRDAMQVEVTMTGYLDDSVSGEQYVALVEPGGDGWVLSRLWKRYLCARGRNAGQWTADVCP